MNERTNERTLEKVELSRTIEIPSNSPDKTMASPTNPLPPNPHTRPLYSKPFSYSNSILFSLSKHATMSLIPHLYGRRSNVFVPFSVEMWDPFQGWPSNSNFRSVSHHIRVDWKQTPTAHIFKADVPGLKKEEVMVEVEEGRVLQISGKRNHEHEDKGDKWHHVERSSGNFLRRFRPPENAKLDQVEAAMENGVLTVTVPKVEVKKHDVKSIQVSG